MFVGICACVCKVKTLITLGSEAWGAVCTLVNPRSVQED